MAPPPDYFTQMLPGQLTAILGAAAFLTFPISFLLLRLYRRAVLKSMERRTEARGEAAEDLPRADKPSATSSPKPAAPLQIISLQEQDAVLTPEGWEHYNQAVRTPWRAAAVYSLGGAIFVAIMTMAILVSGKVQISPLRFLLVSWTYTWPILLSLGLLVGSSARTRLLLALVYLCLYGILGAIAVALSPKFSFIQQLILWVLFNVPPTALVLAYLSRRVRAVGPLVLIVLILASAGAVFFSKIIGYHSLWRKFASLPLNFDFASQVISSFHLHGSAVFGVSEWPLLREVVEDLFRLAFGGPGFAKWILIRDLVGFAVFGALGCLLVQWIRARYERKEISDQSLTLDSLWLLFGIVYSLGGLFSSRGPLWAISGLVAFLAYKIAVAVGFAMAKGPGAGQGVKLLLLRVFALGRRSQKLFDDFGINWRYIGPIQMIAGPDLATTTIEPHEFLEFLTRKLSRRFIDGQETLNQQVSQMDLKPDRDWRYRINDFFCFADTWKMALHRLVSESDAVLMDLRSFSRERSGCIFEIKEIINSVSLDRAVFIVDATTDEPYLRQVVEEAWEGLRPGSPNHDSPSPRLSLFHYSGTQSHDRLLRAVCAAARPA